MPAASWPRCCRACRPSAVMAAASGWPKMPNTPHSSRSVSPSRSSCSSIAAASSRWIGVCVMARRIGRVSASRPSRLSFWPGINVPAGFSISFFRPSRAGLAIAIAGAGGAGSASVCSSSGLFFLNLFKMVFSGSSGKSDISHSPVPSQHRRATSPPVTQSGRCLSGTSQVKNRKATTTIRSPRASPNRKPRVRSSAPIRESRIMSEIRTVMMETTIRVPMNTPATTTTLAMVSLLK